MEFDFLLGVILKASLVALPVLTALVALLYFVVRVRERYRMSDALVSAEIMAAVHAVEISGRRGVVIGISNTKEAIIEWMDSDGDGIPDNVDPEPEVRYDPRHALLIELCNCTIHHGDYGAKSSRILTADDAQAYCKDHGGQFIDRNKWDQASKYGQEFHILYKKTGGTEQGMMVDTKTGGSTVAHLLTYLSTSSAILNGAIAALPRGN